jgi:hypothetical protein
MLDTHDEEESSFPQNVVFIVLSSSAVELLSAKYDVQASSNVSQSDCSSGISSPSDEWQYLEKYTAYENSVILSDRDIWRIINTRMVWHPITSVKKTHEIERTNHSPDSTWSRTRTEYTTPNKLPLEAPPGTPSSPIEAMVAPTPWSMNIDHAHVSSHLSGHHRLHYAVKLGYRWRGQKTADIRKAITLASWVRRTRGS